MNPNPIKTIERLAIHTDLARLSRLWWFWGLVIEENLIPLGGSPRGLPMGRGSGGVPIVRFSLITRPQNHHNRLNRAKSA